MIVSTLGSSFPDPSFCKSPTPLSFTPSRIEFSNTDTVLSLPLFPRCEDLAVFTYFHMHHFILVVLPLVRDLFLVTCITVSCVFVYLVGYLCTCSDV